MAATNGQHVPRRPCATSFARRDASGLKVPFARCGDGVARHVSQIRAREHRPFHCLDCDEPLTLRSYVNKRTHLAHQPGSQCAGETALHIYAKELLARERTLTFPALTLREEGIDELVCEGGVFDLATVELESKEGDFQPDATVRIGEETRAVEFKVSHAVDHAKRQKVLRRDMPMIEIELDRLKAADLDADGLDHAILHTAPRHWIHHPAQDAGAKRLAARVTAHRQERGRRLRWHIEHRPQSPKVSVGWREEVHERLADAGLLPFVGLEVDGGHWFVVPGQLWQAAILDSLILSACQHYAPMGGARVGQSWGNAGLAGQLPDWIIRTDLSKYPPKRLEEAGFTRESYGSPEHAVHYYLAKLAMRGQVVRWDADDRCFRVESELHERVYRLRDVRRRLLGILTQAKIPDPAGLTERWLNRYNVSGKSPRTVIFEGGEPLTALVERLARLERMSQPYGKPAVAEDLCGLPLKALQAQRLEEVAALNAKEEQALVDARQARVARIRRDALHHLAEEAAAWLAQGNPHGEGTMTDMVATNEEKLDEALAMLAATARFRRHRIAQEAEIARLREALTKRAAQAFPDEQRAHLFLNSGHPRLQGQRPFDACISTVALDKIVALLPAGRLSLKPRRCACRLGEPQRGRPCGSYVAPSVKDGPVVAERQSCLMR